MHKVLGWPLLLGILLFSVTFYWVHNQSSENNSTYSTFEKIEESVSRLVPIEEKLGRLFVIGHWAHTPVASTTELLQEYQLGGVIIMSAPEDTGEIKNWTNGWQEAVDYPLLIAIDQEGGVVQRLRGADFIDTAQPEIASVEEAYAVAEQRGTELSSLGINTNFAPVVEASVNPDGFLYDRVFRSPETIASFAGAMIEGYETAGVIPVIKHYPGHEDEPTDSHHDLPIVELENTTFADHTKNFQHLLSQAPMLMTAHVLVPDIDPEYPATLSKKILTGELRTNQGYEGVIITDDMTMDAIDTRFSTTKATELALLAGADMILFAAEPTEVEMVVPYVTTHIEQNAELRQAIQTHVTRRAALFGDQP